MTIKFDLATNFDNELIRKVAPLGIVRNVYGKLSEDIIGGGRPSFALPKVSKKELNQHIQVCHENGISFNYLFNALCMDNRELSRKTNKQIRDFIRFIEDSGADSVTVGSPLLLRIAKETSPELEVEVSIYNDIDSLAKIKEWERLGADELTLHYSYNRNFKKLEQVLRSSDMNFRLIANNVCMHECLFRTNHAVALAHASQSKHESRGFFLDYFSLKCGAEKLANPVKLISADWIRPEDVHFYEELCDKIGKSNLTLKLTDRSRSTDWLVNVANAYASRSYEGNLFDILNYIGNREYAQVHKKPFVLATILNKALFKKMLEFQKAVFLTPVYAENKSLDGFMEPILSRDCSNYICDDQGWKEEASASSNCTYCRRWAERVLQFPAGENARKTKLEECASLVKDFETGKMYSK